MVESSTFPFPADLLMKLGKKEEAVTLYKSLLDRNPENWATYHNLETALGVG